MAVDADGSILRWREEAGVYIVLLTDGRKLREPIHAITRSPKPKKEAPAPKPTPRKSPKSEPPAVE